MRRLLFLALFLALSAAADVPEAISYSGRLLDSDGNVVNGEVVMKFLIWDKLKNGALLYQDWHDGSNANHPLVTVTDGLYKVAIGDDTTNHGDATYLSLKEALAAEANPYLEVVVAGTALSPREPLRAVPYAISAGDVDTPGANRELDNLQNVAINVSLLPDTDNAIDLGSSAKAWRNAYVKGVLSDGTNAVAVANIATLSGTQTLTNKTLDPAANAIALASGKVLIGGASNVAAPQTVSGDLSLSTTGVAAIQAGAVGTSKIADRAVTAAKIASASADQVLTTDASGAPQWENKTVFLSSTLAQNHIFVGASTGTAVDTANLPAAALPTGGDWALSGTLNIDNNTLAIDPTNDNVGVGVDTPTAALHLKAGTATAGTAPLKLTAGTNLTTPEAGALEYDGTNLSFTASDAVRRTVTLTNAPPFDYKNFTFFFDDFDAASSTSNDWTASNSSGSSAPTTVTAGQNAPGIIQFTTGTSAVGRAKLYRYAAAYILGQGAFTFESRIRVPTLSAATQEFSFTVGLHDATVRDAVDGVYFIYDRATYASSNPNNMRCVTSSNSTRTVSDSGYAIVAGTWFTCKAVINAAGTEARFYINNALVATHTTNIPVGAGRATGPGAQILKSVGTSARTVQLDYWAHYIAFATAR